MSYDLYDRVLGCLLAAGMGDGIGAPTEGLSQDEIAAEYGKAVETFEDGSQNFYSLGNDVAEVTDDASQMYEMAKEIVSCGGVMTPQAAARAVLRWSESYPKYYPRNAGPTTSLVIEDLKNGADPIAVGMQGRRYGRGTSNGASMRVAAAGLTAVGDREKAITNAVAMSRPTHGTQHAFSGACAIACGVSEALKEDADVLSIVQACLYGARRGEEIGLATARRASGCSTVRCIERAVAAALPHEDMPSALDAIEYEVGNGVAIQESVAAAIAIFMAAHGDVEKTILGGANIGGDTDTIACMAGMLAGAYRGAASIRLDWRKLFKTANPALDFETAARELTKLAQG